MNDTNIALILQKLDSIEEQMTERLEGHDKTIEKLAHILTGNGTPGLCEQVREVAAVHKNLERRFDEAKLAARYWIGGTFFLVMAQWVKFLFAKVFPMGG